MCVTKASSFKVDITVFAFSFVAHCIRNQINKKWKRITENILEFTFTPTFAHTLAVTNEQYLDKYAAKQSKARMGLARLAESCILES